MSLFNLFRNRNRRRMKHYHEERERVGGERIEVRLEQVFSDGVSVNMVYRWQEDLSHQQADQLDSRLRAYITCAICDAASEAGLKCRSGPDHGRRPSWMITPHLVPFSLQQAGFDVTEKVCWLSIGPVSLKGPGPYLSEGILSELADSFGKRFDKITV
jgi:hypothetical protein